MDKEEEKEIGGCSCVGMAHGSCGEGRQKPKAGKRQEKAFLGYESEGGVQQSWDTQGACPSRAETCGAQHYGGSRLSGMYMAPEQQSREGGEGSSMVQAALQ